MPRARATVRQLRPRREPPPQEKLAANMNHFFEMQPGFFVNVPGGVIAEKIRKRIEDESLIAEKMDRRDTAIRNAALDRQAAAPFQPPVLGMPGGGIPLPQQLIDEIDPRPTWKEAAKAQAEFLTLIAEHIDPRTSYKLTPEMIATLITPNLLGDQRRAYGLVTA